MQFGRGSISHVVGRQQAGRRLQAASCSVCTHAHCAKHTFSLPRCLSWTAPPLPPPMMRPPAATSATSEQQRQAPALNRLRQFDIPGRELLLLCCCISPAIASTQHTSTQQTHTQSHTTHTTRARSISKFLPINSSYQGELLSFPLSDKLQVRGGYTAVAAPWLPPVPHVPAPTACT